MNILEQKHINDNGTVNNTQVLFTMQCEDTKEVTEMTEFLLRKVRVSIWAKRQKVYNGK